MELQGMYRALGVSPAVYDFGQQVLAGLRERFDQVDAVVTDVEPEEKWKRYFAEKNIELIY